MSPWYKTNTLAERYDMPLPELTDDVDTLTGKVNAHLKKMGFTWK